MPKVSPLVALDRTLSTLTRQWHEHRDALAAIDAVFAKYGVNPAKAAPTAPAKPTVEATAAAPADGKPRRKRRQFAQTADQLVLGLLAGGKGLTGSQISEAWQAAGRPGRADTTLSILYKDKKVKRTPLKDGRGSTYTLA